MKSASNLNHVGRLVPRNAKVISVLLVLVAVVNSAVRVSHLHTTLVRPPC